MAFTDEQELLDQLRRAFGPRVEIVGRPGGKGRKTVFCRIDGRLCAVALRRSEGRAELEAAILRRLGRDGLSPRLIGRKGALVVQAHVAGRRLSEHLDTADPTEAEALMARAAEALIAAQAVAAREGLSGRVPVIGARPGWATDLAHAPAQLARSHGLPVPEADFGALLEADPKPHFIKWDARPGNALVTESGAVCWIDWEHAGARSPVDDLVWLFADEWAPEAPVALEAALAQLSERDGTPPEALRAQFIARAVAHSSVRLSLIFARKGEGPWWRHAACLQHDRVGVTPGHVRHVAGRASVWAKELPGLLSLVPIFESLAARTEG
ncbi:Phosphotransferase enzyme family [Marinovum algicola DG 898]|nr:Phosphotransferase enzyme family [Marinovum algicola DG 898]